MAKQFLSYEVKHYIVTQLARRRQPFQVMAEVRAEFGIVVSKQQLQRYDPTTKAGQSLAANWRDLFYRHRVEFDKELEERARRRA